MKLNTTILKDAAHCFRDARGSLIEGAKLLHTIYSKQLYLEAYTTFGEYVEQECQLSPSYASKLIKTYEHYVINGSLSHAKLKDIEPEKLYLAINLKGTPTQQLSKALTLSRGELKSERFEKEGHDCQHPVTIKICATCHAKI